MLVTIQRQKHSRKLNCLGAMLLAHVGILSCAVAAESGVVRIVCLGDSVTKAVREGVRPEETFCAVLEQRLKAAGQDVTVVNAGIGGHTTKDGLQRFDKDVLSQQPDYVVIMFGLNDSWIDAGKTASRLTVDEYRANLENMLARLKERGIKAVLMTPNAALQPTYGTDRNATLKPYVEAVRTLAAERGIPLVDVYRNFAELALEGPDVNALFTDAMHPNPAGQKLIAHWLNQYFARELSQRTKEPGKPKAEKP
jgi:acyl-CoA thioesterase-1